MFPLSTIRHSASHILAQAVLHFFPKAKLGIGPSIDDGFYYDFDIDQPISENDLEKIEAKMKDIIRENQAFSRFDANKEKALSIMTEKNQPLKIELIEDLNLDSYSFFENGPFLDLCKGPHVESTAQVPAIKLLKVSGAYWRGSEKNKMLQRIYGTAFHSQAELDEYLLRLEEAQKRDHRLLGKELDLFSIQEEVGGGLILWHPKGAFIRHTIESYWKQAHFEAGYELLYSPHIGLSDLWKTSGHLDFYKENMYSPIQIEDQDYILKPMNCPYHIMMYANQPRSYRDLPIRYAELGTVYRYERSGVLHGLMRVRGFTQDDAHIMCTKEQMDSEIHRVLTFCFDMLKAFGFEKINIYISTRPEEKYVGSIDDWLQAEKALENSVMAMGLPYKIDQGGGAFYGPKIDIKIEDALGREWQCSTIQFDFNLPERFNMTYIGPDGQKHRPLMVHRALLGSIERFFGILVEHFAGKFPLWLAPVHVALVVVSEKQLDYATKVQETLKQQGIRSQIMNPSEKMGYNIRQAIQQKIPYQAVLGDKEKETQTLAIRANKENLGTLSISDFAESVLEKIKQKSKDT